MTNDETVPALKPKTLDLEQQIADDDAWLGDGALREKYDTGDE